MRLFVALAVALSVTAFVLGLAELTLSFVVPGWFAALLIFTGTWIFCVVYESVASKHIGFWNRLRGATRRYNGFLLFCPHAALLCAPVFSILTGAAWTWIVVGFIAAFLVAGIERFGRFA